MVGQIARVHGCKTVVGTAGSDEKVKILKDEFGFTHALNYKTIGDDIAKMKEELTKAFPKGIDVYFDNTGLIFLFFVFCFVFIFHIYLFCKTISILLENSGQCVVRVCLFFEAKQTKIEKKNKKKNTQ